MNNNSSRAPLGQHFLQNPRAIKNIIASLDLANGERVIEIGPGKGALTLPLAIACKKIGCSIIAIEKDPALVNQLTSELGSLEDIQVVHADALKELPHLIDRLIDEPATYKLVGNIPYYITGKLLRIISELPKKPRRTVLMIQREVAERIMAAPPRMNLLAAAVQVWATPQLIMSLTPGDFSPPPEVHSAVISLTTNPAQLAEDELQNYYSCIRTLFKQPRKTILNNLRAGYPRRTAHDIKNVLLRHGFPENARPQDISLPVLIKFASYFASQGIK